MPQKMRIVDKKFVEPSQVDSQTTSLQKDEWLENVVIGFRDNTYVMDQFMPEKAVKKDSAKIRVYSPKGRFKGAPKRAETALPGQSALVYAEDSYDSEEYALEGWVSDGAVRNAANDLEPIADEAEYLTGKIYLTQEILIVNEILTSVKAAGAAYYTSLAAATRWDTGASANILGDLSTAIKAITKSIGKRPNVIGLDTDTLEAVTNNATLVDILKNTTSNMITDANVVNQLRGMRLVLADAVVNTGTWDVPVYTNILYDLDPVAALNQFVIVAYLQPNDKLTLGSNYVSMPFKTFKARGLEGERRQSTLVYVAKRLGPKVTTVGAAHIIGKVLG